MKNRYMQHIKDGSIYAWTPQIANDNRLRMLPAGFDPRVHQVPSVEPMADMSQLPDDARTRIAAIPAEHGLSLNGMPLNPGALIAAQQAQRPVTSDVFPPVIGEFENVQPVSGAIPVERVQFQPDETDTSEDDATQDPAGTAVDPLTGMSRNQLLEFARENNFKVKLPANAATLRTQLREQIAASMGKGQ